ncbi:MAG: tetratricopeptide repeat protein [Phycisphaerae bacterium]
MGHDNIATILTRANALLEEGKPAETLRCLDQLGEDALVERDERVEYATLRAWALSEMGRAQEALDALDPLLQEFPACAKLHGTRGVVLSNADRLDAARAALERAVALDADDDVGVANLALVYEKLRDYHAAVRHYERAMNLGADLDWALNRAAAALSAAGRTDEARIVLKRYLSLVPDDAEQWVALAILFSDDDEHHEAFACYRAAERIDAELVTLRLNWGVTAVRAGRLKLARRQLRQLQKLAPGSARTCLLRGFILEEEGKLSAAEVCYEDALRCVRGNDFGELAYVLEMAMDFYCRQRRIQQCEALFSRAYALGACTVELCEAYREALGERVAHGYWFSLLVETDHQPRAVAHLDPNTGHADRPSRRALRSFQVVAVDHDEALGLVLRLAKRLGETGVRVREFLREEPIQDAFVGVYEIAASAALVTEEAPHDR